MKFIHIKNLMFPLLFFIKISQIIASPPDPPSFTPSPPPSFTPSPPPSFSPLQWSDTQHLNCHPGFGSVDHACCSTHGYTLQVDIESCQRHCDDTVGCDGITMCLSGGRLRGAMLPSTPDGAFAV